MNIIYRDNYTKNLNSKYILLELDTFQRAPDELPKTSYCLISKDQVLLQEIPYLESNQELHNNMMKNYKIKNWKFCEDALTILVGKFRGEVDSFYKVMQDRIVYLKEAKQDLHWTPIITIPEQE